MAHNDRIIVGGYYDGNADPPRRLSVKRHPKFRSDTLSIRLVYDNNNDSDESFTLNNPPDNTNKEK